MKIRTDKSGKLHVEGGKIRRRGTRVVVKSATNPCTSTQYNHLLCNVKVAPPSDQPEATEESVNIDRKERLCAAELASISNAITPYSAGYVVVHTRWCDADANPLGPYSTEERRAIANAAIEEWQRWAACREGLLETRDEHAFSVQLPAGRLSFGEWPLDDRLPLGVAGELWPAIEWFVNGSHEGKAVAWEISLLRGDRPEPLAKISTITTCGGDGVRQRSECSVPLRYPALTQEDSNVLVLRIARDGATYTELDAPVSLLRVLFLDPPEKR